MCLIIKARTAFGKNKVISLSLRYDINKALIIKVVKVKAHMFKVFISVNKFKGYVFKSNKLDLVKIESKISFIFIYNFIKYSLLNVEGMTPFFSQPLKKRIGEGSASSLPILRMALRLSA